MENVKFLIEFTLSRFNDIQYVRDNALRGVQYHLIMDDAEA